MNSFTAAFNDRPVSQSTLGLVRSLGQSKGQQLLYQHQLPEVLRTLRESAFIQSVESSNRIEGVEVSDRRLQALVRQAAPPRTRPEQEIAGYRSVLDTIHASHHDIPFNPSHILQLHRQLFQFSSHAQLDWKTVNNSIRETRADGSYRERFVPVPAWQTPMAMDELHLRWSQAWNSGHYEHLLLIPAYVLDFLCIHPFLDGNGRMARLLTVLLLYQAGSTVGRFISLEKIIEDSRESYYETLELSSQGWHEGRHDLQPFTDYLLGTFVAAYRSFAAKVEELAGAHGTKTQALLHVFDSLPPQFRLSDLNRLCPHVSRDMVRVVLNQLRAQGRVVTIGRGPGARWHKTGPPPPA